MAKMMLGIVLRAIPWERVIATVVRHIVARFENEPENNQVYERAATALRRSGEAIAAGAYALEYRDLNQAEAQQTLKHATALLSAWEDGDPTPRDAEAEVFSQDHIDISKL